MATSDRMETKRTVCDCGKGEFIFYTCELDGWSWARKPNVEWYEMGIACETCLETYKSLVKSNTSRGKAKVGLVRIDKRETLPMMK